jgi:hypothetical protein
MKKAVEIMLISLSRMQDEHEYGKVYDVFNTL